MILIRKDREIGDRKIQKILPRIGADERGSGNCQKSPQMPKIVEIEKQNLEPQETKEHGG
jgi:hypothetical protein